MILHQIVSRLTIRDEDNYWFAASIFVSAPASLIGFCTEVCQAGLIRSQTKIRECIGVQDETDYKALHQDALKELEAARAEASEHRDMLREDAAKAREDANAGRAEAARMRNEAAYERERCQRLQEQLSDSLKQVDGLTQSNTKYQVMVSTPSVLMCKHNGMCSECPVPVSHSMQNASHAVEKMFDVTGGAGIRPCRWR